MSGNPWKHNVDLILNSFSGPILIQDSSRRDLALLYAKLGFTHGAEIGVAAGAFSEMICECVPGVKLDCIDAWQPWAGYHDYTDPGAMERDYQTAQARLEKYGVNFVRQFSMEAVRQYDDNSLDFVYIDACHESPYIDNDIYWWSKKVRPGGIVSGHDYVGNHTDVINAVKFYVSKNGISPYWIVGRQGEQDAPDYVCSWFFVRGEDELSR